MDNFSWDSNFLPPQPPENSSSSSHYSCRRTISDEDAFTTVASSSPKRRAGRKKFNETRHPVYKGVRRRNGDKWVCEVREPKKKSRIWLGTFPTPEMAARAHDVAAIALRGRSACLNFADSAWLLPVPSSTNARDIQKAAAEAAEAFRPSGTASVQKSEPHPPEKVFYMEEESDLGMPTILANMAEGSLLSPPRLDSWSESNWDDVERDADVSLWSYSI